MSASKEVLDALLERGWSLDPSGGGCMWFTKAHDTPMTRFEAITDPDGAGIPEELDDPMVWGLHNMETGDEEQVKGYASVQEFLDRTSDDYGEVIRRLSTRCAEDAEALCHRLQTLGKALTGYGQADEGNLLDVQGQDAFDIAASIEQSRPGWLRFQDRCPDCEERTVLCKCAVQDQTPQQCLVCGEARMDCTCLRYYKPGEQLPPKRDL